MVRYNDLRKKIRKKVRKNKTLRIFKRILRNLRGIIFEVNLEEVGLHLTLCLFDILLILRWKLV